VSLSGVRPVIDVYQKLLKSATQECPGLDAMANNRRALGADDPGDSSAEDRFGRSDDAEK
jgi:hypothetical protein